MEYRRQTLRFGAAMLVLAVAIRLLSAGFFAPLTELFTQQGWISALVYLETGWVVRFPQPQEQEAPVQTQAPTAPQYKPREFSGEDLQWVQVKYHCNYRPDLSELLTKPLSWERDQDGPEILIVHTHATETYTGEDIPYSGDYRTLDSKYNMLAVGERLAQALEAGGVSVLHDKTLHDYPSYNGSYDNARASIEAYLRQYPSIRMVLDLHRDASSSAQQLDTCATVHGEKAAQLMLVVGTDGGVAHPNWRENLSLALKMQVLLEKENPGLCRPMDLRWERFNADLSPGSLLVEVGGAGDSLQEALVAAQALGQGILQLLG